MIIRKLVLPILLTFGAASTTAFARTSECTSDDFPGKTMTLITEPGDSIRSGTGSATLNNDDDDSEVWSVEVTYEVTSISPITIEVRGTDFEMDVANQGRRIYTGTATFEENSYEVECERVSEL